MVMGRRVVGMLERRGGWDIFSGGTPTDGALLKGTGVGRLVVVLEIQPQSSPPAMIGRRNPIRIYWPMERSVWTRVFAARLVRYIQTVCGILGRDLQ